jgi:hypothetical protein
MISVKCFREVFTVEKASPPPILQLSPNGGVWSYFGVGINLGIGAIGADYR